MCTYMVQAFLTCGIEMEKIIVILLDYWDIYVIDVILFSVQ